MMPVPPALRDQLLKDDPSADALVGEDGLLQQLTTAVVECALQAELTHQLGSATPAPAGKHTGNARTGTSPTTGTGTRGQVHSEVPRDRTGACAPQRMQQGQTRCAGRDENMIALSARGMPTRAIQGHLEELDGVEVAPRVIATVTDAVMEAVRAWQNRPRATVYPILYLDAIQVKVRTQGRVITTAS